MSATFHRQFHSTIRRTVNHLLRQRVGVVCGGNWRHGSARGWGWIDCAHLHSSSATANAPKVVQFNLADIGEGITECELVQWFISKGDTIQQFDKICEVQSDKATVEISSRFDGLVTKLYYEAGETALVGSPLIDISLEAEDGSGDGDTTAPTEDSTSAAPSIPSSDSVPTSPTPVQSFLDGTGVLATPAVRRVSRELDVDLSMVRGTGKGGRILKEDVINFAERGEPPVSPATSAVGHDTPARVGGDHVHVLTPVEKAMVKSMTQSLTIPHFGFSDQLPFHNLSHARLAINGFLQSGDSGYGMSKISFMPLLVKSFSLALTKFPQLNANFFPDGSAVEAKPHVIHRTHHNIGLAIDSPHGLVVPNIKNIQDKSVVEIAEEMKALQEQASQGKIPPSAFADATITISNIGNLGGTTLGPVIPPGTVCIAAIGKSRLQPHFEKDASDEWKMEPREYTTVSFSADHRVVDGATVARFFNEWKSLVENPSIMLLKMK